MSKGEPVAEDHAVRGADDETCAPRRGRPLDTGLEEAILGATVELLGQRGFDRFTVQDIADRAGVGLGAIYRRWPTKLDAVMAAVRLLAEDDPTTVPSGDVEEDLARALISSVHSLAGCLGAVVPGLISAMRHDPDLARLMRETAVGPRVEMFRDILAPAFPDAAERDLRTEMAMAIPLYRLLITGKFPTDREIRTKLVPLVLGRPLTGAKRSAARPRARRAG
jgi:AcrR family transcriptional regulator